MERRGLTLLEVLIALALLVLLSSLVVPAVWRRIGPLEFEETTRRIEAALSLARGDAQRDGVPVRVVVRAASNANAAEIVAEPLRIGDDEVEPTASPWGDSFAPAPEGVAAAFDQPVETRAGHERVLLTLPEGFSIGSTPPDGDRAPGAASAIGVVSVDRGFGDERPAAGADGRQAPVTVAVFLPDGSAIASGTLYVTGTGGRAAALSVSRWTGAATVRPIASGDPASGVTEAEASEDAEAAVPGLGAPPNAEGGV